MPAALEVSEADANGTVSEKPKAPARRRAPRIHVPGDPDAKPTSPEVIQEAVAEGAVETTAADADLDAEAGLDDAPTLGADGDGPVVVKRKTRRGSRGGKNRRKKPAAVDGVAGVAAGGEADATGVATVEIESPEDGHDVGDVPELASVPVADPVVEPESSVEPEPIVEPEPVVAETAAPAPDESAAAESDAPDYVPMSEWLDDFDRR